LLYEKRNVSKDKFDIQIGPHKENMRACFSHSFPEDREMIKRANIISLALISIAYFVISDKCLSEITLVDSQQNICNIIDSGDLEAARKATDKLMTNFANNPNLPEMIYWTIRHCEWKDKFDEAKRLYQIILQNYPGTAFAEKAQLGIARCEAMRLVMGQQYELARVAVNKMVSDFPANEDLPESLGMIAERFEWQRRFEDEKWVYRLIIQIFAHNLFAHKAQIGIVRADVLSFIVGKDSVRFDMGMDKLFTNFASNPELPQTAIIIGEWFYKDGLTQKQEGLKEEAKNNFEKAINIWNRVIAEQPNSDLIPEACCWIGDSYTELGQYNKAIEFYKRSCNDYPEPAETSGINISYRWRSMYMIGQSYTLLKKSGDINNTEADTLIIESYEHLVRVYPNCSLAKNAWLELGIIYADNNRWPDTIRCYEAYQNISPKGQCPPEVFYEIANAYDRIGNIDLAKKNYAIFVSSTIPNTPKRKEANIRLMEIMKSN